MAVSAPLVVTVDASQAIAALEQFGQAVRQAAQAGARTPGQGPGIGALAVVAAAASGSTRRISRRALLLPFSWRRGAPHAPK